MMFTMDDLFLLALGTVILMVMLIAWPIVDAWQRRRAWLQAEKDMQRKAAFGRIRREASMPTSWYRIMVAGRPQHDIRARNTDDAVRRWLHETMGYDSIQQAASEYGCRPDQIKAEKFIDPNEGE